MSSLPVVLTIGASDASGEFALISDADPRSSLVLSSLYDDSGLVRSDTVPRPGSGGRWTSVGTTLSAALAGLLAQGVDLPEAGHEATQYAAAALLNAFPAGIGVTVPDRLFWAGEDEDEPDDTGSTDIN
jgi:hydroxymethylpyrimidine/phosphomethylpyrimidine kinase